MVTVVDANRFVHDINSEDLLMDRDQSVDETDERSIADLIDQVEFCDVLIINKIDLISEEELAKLEKVLSALQPTAKIIKTTNSEVDLKEVLNTQRFDFEKRVNQQDGLKSLNLVVMHRIRLKQKNMAYHHLYINVVYLSMLKGLMTG